MLPVYRASGKVSFSLVPSAVLTIGFAAVAAWAYQNLLIAIGGIYLHFFIFAFGAVACGAIGALGVRWGRCRGSGIALLLGATVGVTATVTSHYVSYQDFRANRALLAVGHAPLPWLADELAQLTFANSFASRTKVGYDVRRLRGGQTEHEKGASIWIPWLIEAGLFLFAGAIGAVMQSSLPYCERCNRWLGTAKEVLRRPVAGAAVGERVKTATSFEALVPPPAAAASPFTLIYEAKSCATCDGTRYLSISLEEVGTDAKGRARKVRRTQQRDVAVTGAELALICGSVDQPAT